MFLSLLVFFLILSVLVLAHELGHYLAAKKAGIRVEEFGFGYPPRIWSKKRGETVWSINAIPFGGFVRLYGEELEEIPQKMPAKKTQAINRAFWAKSKKARSGVILAGVLANFFLAIVCFSVVYSFSGIPTQTNQVRIVAIAPDSPAQLIGLKEEDLVLMVDQEKVTGLDQFVALVEKNKGREIILEVRRDQEELTFLLTPRQDPPGEEGALGVVVSNIEMKKYPFWQMPFRGAVEGFKEAWGWGGLILQSLKKMVLDLLFLGAVPRDIAGPVGIFQISAGVARAGILNILQFLGILSVNLAIINVLPLPALDGGRLIFVVYEAIARRRPKPKIEHWVNLVGMAFLLILIVLITVNDLNRIFQTTLLGARLRSLWPF